MSFGREAGLGGRHGTDLFASYMWMCMKYVLLATCITHSVTIMRAIFEMVADIGIAMQNVGGLGSATTSAYADAFMEVCRDLTYGQGFGLAFVIMLIALVVLVICALTAIFTQVTMVIRVFECAVLMAFSSIAFVMLGHQGTRESGIRYIKRFAGVCVQALVILLVVALGGLFIDIAINQFAFGSSSESAVGFLMGLVGPLVSCIAMFLMVKQARDIANAIVGA